MLRQRKKKNAPPKPERRRRNMTTGFEDLPSQLLSAGPPVLTRQTSSDPDLTAIIYEAVIADQPSTSSGGIPLKSAMKSPGSFETKADSDANTHPKRPVRIIAPEKIQSSQEPTSVNIYSNIEIVQRGLGSSNTKTSISSVIFTADAETQCSQIAPPETEVTSGSQPQDLDAFESMITMNRAALMRLAAAAPQWDGVEWDESSARPWDDLGSTEGQPCCTVSGGAFFKVVRPENEPTVTSVLVNSYY